MQIIKRQKFLGWKPKYNVNSLIDDMIKMKGKFFYPLTKENLNTEDIKSGIRTLRTKKITMGKKTLEIETYFSKKIIKRDY